MKIDCQTDGLQISFFDDGHALAHVYMRDASTVTTTHYPRSDRCHEFVGIVIETPCFAETGMPTSVHMNLDISDARRLYESIGAALAKAYSARATA